MLSSPSESPLAGQRVAVALSGGVDSAVTAALLKAQGAEVIGLTMLLQKSDTPDDARAVARKLDIPLDIVDVTAAFASCVMEGFADSYLRGETPIPCVVCNRQIKFGRLMEVAREKGAVALATGHYARRLLGQEGGSAELHRGANSSRDQSYFLFALSQQQIDFLRFPLGDLSKDQTRALAAQYALPVASKPDSQDICFVPGGDYVSVLEKLRPGSVLSGDIVDEQGRVLGRHEGVVHFTVGQRKGLNLHTRQGDHNPPLYVLRLDAIARRVVVGPREALARREVFLRDVNWLGPPAPEEGEGLPVAVRLRSAQEPVLARFWRVPGERGRILLEQPVFGVAPGQAGVVYQGTRLRGGGWICGSE